MIKKILLNQLGYNWEKIHIIKNNQTFAPLNNVPFSLQFTFKVNSSNILCK